MSRKRFRSPSTWDWLAVRLQNAGEELEAGDLDAAAHELKSAARHIREKEHS